MTLDADNYGFPAGYDKVQRLVDDVRVMGVSGIERVAAAWDRHIGDSGHADFENLEKAAVHAVEQADRGEVWGQVRRTLFGMTESDKALLDWRGEHGDQGHKAERAVQAAALALVAGNLIDEETRRKLKQPLADALPWLSESA